MLQVSDMIYRHGNMQIQSACMPPVHIYLSKGMFLQSAFGPATTRSPDPPVWPRSGVMILPTGILIHQPPHILSQLYRPLLAATFRSRSFACFTFGRFTGTCNLGVDRGSAFWASPASSHAQYARRTWDTDHATRITIDAGDTGIVVPDCTVPPFRTPCARCSSLVSTSAPMVSALTIEASEARSRLDLPGDSESSLRLCRRHCHRLCRRDSWLLDCTSGCARKRCGSIEKRCKDMLALCLFLS